MAIELSLDPLRQTELENWTTGRVVERCMDIQQADQVGSLL